MRRTIVTIFANAEADYAKWLRQNFKHPKDPEKVKALAHVAMASLLEYLKGDDWMAKSQALPSMTGTKYALRLQKTLCLVIDVVEPLWWQFWKPRQVRGLKFGTFRFADPR